MLVPRVMSSWVARLARQVVGAWLPSHGCVVLPPPSHYRHHRVMVIRAAVVGDEALGMAVWGESL